MADESPKSHPFDCEVRYPHPQSPLAVRLDISYSSDPADGRVMDMYSPVDRVAPAPAIIIGSGYPAAGLRKHFGHSSRRFPATTSWARLLASEGVTAIAYDAVDAASDLASLIAFLQTAGMRLGIDAKRLGVLACSGNVPAALAALATGGLRCAILLYGFMLDGPDGETVAAAARQFGFANPSTGLTTDDLPQTTHLLIVRAGKDGFAGLNATLDRFAADALGSNLPITIINHANASHAFDLVDTNRETRHVIGEVLTFARFQLLE